MQTLHTPSDINHEAHNRRWDVLQTAFLGVQRIHRVVDQAHDYFLESDLSTDDHDTLDALLTACLALITDVRRAMAEECDSEDEEAWRIRSATGVSEAR